MRGHVTKDLLLLWTRIQGPFAPNFIWMYTFDSIDDTFVMD
jgi:hypothetical protein